MAGPMRRQCHCLRRRSDGRSFRTEGGISSAARGAPLMKFAPLLAAGLVLSTSALVAQPTVTESNIGTPGAVDGETVTDEMAIRTDATRRMTVNVSVAGQGP